MQRKKVDERVRTLIDNGVKSRTRSMFVIVGDRGKDQVANLHYILTKAQVKARPSVLWCYSKELGFSTLVFFFGSGSHSSSTTWTLFPLCTTTPSLLPAHHHILKHTTPTALDYYSTCAQLSSPPLAATVRSA